jgi:hypothetical protein
MSYVWENSVLQSKKKLNKLKSTTVFTCVKKFNYEFQSVDIHTLLHPQIFTGREGGREGGREEGRKEGWALRLLKLP